MNSCISYDDLINFAINGDQIAMIEEEWYKFIEGKPVDTNRVPLKIFKSWQRSKESNINPFDLKQTFLNTTDLENYYKFINSYESSLDEIRKIANENEFIFVFFDRDGKTNQVNDILNHIQFKGDINDSAGINVSEKSLGTNAVILSLLEKRPMKFLRFFHYNKYAHVFNATTAPVFDSKGQILGVFCILFSNHRQLNEAFMLVVSLAKLFEAKISLKSIKDEMKIHDLVLKNIIETIPQGMAYVGKDKVIQYYNKKILEILKIKRTKNIKAEISKYLPIINTKYLPNNRESILNIKVNERPIIVSCKEVINSSYDSKDKIIFLEERKSKIKTYSKSTENTAIYTFEDIIGKNQKLVDAKSLAMRVAKAAVPVLILGESGTGKELFAQSIHNASLRKDGPFVAINCGAIPSELVESELFGYEEGSFTGALKGGKKGKIEAASGGTLFLDEIESMPLNVQIKLLRTLSTKTISKVGGTKEISIDVRIISATKKNLLKEADKERFREDLYYRISTFTIELPPLRERVDDISLLSKYFVNKFSQKYGLINIKIHKKFLEALSYYYWRGNIRELENVIERAIVLLGDYDEITIEHLPNKILKAYKYKSIKGRLKLNEKVKDNTEDLLKIAEEIIIESVLKETNCSFSKASKILGVSRKTLYNKVNESERLTRVKNSYNL